MRRSVVSTLLLVFSLCLTLPSAARAMSMQYAIDLEMFDSVSTDVTPGFYERAGGFSIDDSWLEPIATFVPWSRLESFTLSLPAFSLGAENVAAGTCLTQSVLPFCGVWFLGTELQGMVGQFSMPSSLDDPLYAFRLGNTSPGLFDPDALFQGIAVEDLALGYTVASGRLSMRPVPEPSSIALLVLGGLAVATVLQRRTREH